MERTRSYLSCQFPKRPTFYPETELNVQNCKKSLKIGCVNSLPAARGGRRRDSRNLAFTFSCISVQAFRCIPNRPARSAFRLRKSRLSPSMDDGCIPEGSSIFHIPGALFNSVVSNVSFTSLTREFIAVNLSLGKFWQEVERLNSSGWHSSVVIIAVNSHNATE